MRSRIARMWSPLPMSDRLREEGLRCGYIACPAEPEVDRLSSLVHRSVEVGPVSAYLDIGLSDSTRAASGRPKRFQRLTNYGVYRLTQRRMVVWGRLSPRSA